MRLRLPLDKCGRTIVVGQDTALRNSHAPAQIATAQIYRLSRSVRRLPQRRLEVVGSANPIGQPRRPRKPVKAKPAGPRGCRRLRVHGDRFEIETILQAEQDVVRKEHIMRPARLESDAQCLLHKCLSVFKGFAGYGDVIELAHELGGNVNCKLYDEFGTILISDIDSLTPWICPQTGTYYLRMFDNDHN